MNEVIVRHARGETKVFATRDATFGCTCWREEDAVASPLLFENLQADQDGQQPRRSCSYAGGVGTLNRRSSITWLLVYGSPKEL